MDSMRTGRHIDQLRRRREQVIMTLRHLHKEQEEVERNTDWLDQAAYESRVQLLDRLNQWYAAEIKSIDKALVRADKDDYGLCAACHDPIEDARLNAAPETEFCEACKAMREELEVA